MGADYHWSTGLSGGSDCSSAVGPQHCPEKVQVSVSNLLLILKFHENICYYNLWQGHIYTTEATEAAASVISLASYKQQHSPCRVHAMTSLFAD